MKCPRCGAEIPQGSRFCGGCGTAVTQLRGDRDEGQNNSAIVSILFWVIAFAVIAVGSFLINHFI